MPRPVFKRIVAGWAIGDAGCAKRVAWCCVKAMCLALWLTASGWLPAFCENLESIELEPAQTARPMPSATAGFISAAPRISTSRPSVTDSSVTVPQGALQFESGVTYTDDRQGLRTVTLPETLARLGVTQNTELRYVVPSYVYLRQDGQGQRASNFGDMAVGFSHHLTWPGQVDVALIPLLNLPTGANNVSANSVNPELRVAVSKALTPRLQIGSQFAAYWDPSRRQGNEPAVLMTPTFIAYYGFTDRLSGFAEYAGFIPTQGDSAHVAQGGLIYALSERQQVDVRMATGLTASSPDLWVGVGYSFRVDGLFGK